MTGTARAADWLLIEDALRIILESVPAPEPVEVPLAEAAGRTLAHSVASPVDQPPWDNSAMDGYAVRSADVRGASAAAPVVLRVIEDIPAGAQPRLPLGAGEASRIMTGAPVPAGADGVIRIEHTRDATTSHTTIIDDADAGRNIRFRGEDVRAGDVLFERGTLLGAAEIGVLAMTGHAMPAVARRPRVALLATGDELVGVERIADVAAGTAIINSNTPALAAAVTAVGGVAVPLGIARDDRADLRRHLERALDADVLVTTAGASVGDHDLVKVALEEMGCRTLFWRVKIRPGSPFSFGLVDRPGRAPLPVFGLPGNPVSALVTFTILVAPALRHMLGRTAVYPKVVKVRAGAEITSPPGLVRFLRVRLEDAADGVPRAYLTGPQGSGILTSVAAADALLVMPLDVATLQAGVLAQAVPLRSGDTAARELALKSFEEPDQSGIHRSP